MIRSRTPLDEFADRPRAARVVLPRGLGREHQPTLRELRQARLDRHAAEMRQRNQPAIRKREAALRSNRGPNGWRFAPEMKR